MNSPKIELLIVDDHALFRNGLKMLLLSVMKNVSVAESSDGFDCIEKIKNQKVDVVMMDIDMPKMDGIVTTQKAIEINPDIRIIGLSMHGEEAYYTKMVEAGARGFLLKNSDIEEVVRAIETVEKGEYFFAQSLLSQMFVHNRILGVNESNAVLFSEREQEILEFICQGDSNLEISEKLCISKRTVDKHRANILEKAEVKNTAQLVMKAVKKHWIQI